MGAPLSLIRGARVGGGGRPLFVRHWENTNSTTFGFYILDPWSCDTDIRQSFFSFWKGGAPPALWFMGGGVRARSPPVAPLLKYIHISKYPPIDQFVTFLDSNLEIFRSEKR